MAAVDAVELPPAYVDSLAPLLGDELDAFLASYAAPATRGLRRNARKTGVDLSGLVELIGVPLVPVPWCPTGARLPDGPVPGLGDAPVHRAGLCYLQEPSAMCAAEVLAEGLSDELAGARVADLAAAPGGKTTRLTELVGSEGVVVANEVDRRRLATLHENLDRWGAPNTVTTCRPIEELAAAVGPVFDGVLLDAPCTGEGMFRRDPAAVRHWSPAAVRGSARRQAGLLAAAASLVRPGGVLVYSTCTFAAAENEERIASLCAAEPEWEVADARIDPAFAPGVRVDGVGAAGAAGAVETDRCARLWPHRLAGEGHFVALLRRTGERPPRAVTGAAPGRRRAKDRAKDRSKDRRRAAAGPRGRAGAGDVLGQWREFAAATLLAPPEEVFDREDRVYAAVPGVPVPAELLARPGLPLGRARPGRFEPAQALAGCRGASEVAHPLEWDPDDPRLAAYLRGEAIPVDGPADCSDNGPVGWALVCAHGWGLGWARRRGGVLKNFLPTSLRR